MSAMSVTFEREDREYDLNIQSNSYSADQIARMFQLDPSSLWLKEKFGSNAFFPNANGEFDFTSVDARSCPVIEVIGRSMDSRPQPAAFRPPATLSSTAPACSSSSQSYHGFTSVVAQGRGRRSNDSSFTIKVVQARIRSITGGKPDFRKLGQAYIVATERQASVDFVLREAQSTFGDGYVLVTSDGLEIRDSPGTRGQLLILAIRKYNIKPNHYYIIFQISSCKENIIQH